MKKVLIVGKNSYIGDSFAKYCENDFEIDIVDSMNDKWKEADFSQYDAVYHVAGIAHIKETKDNANLYYKVNSDLVYEVAQKSKVAGVKQFIFLSTMSVYGISNGIIDKDSIPNPKNNYGKSKLQAEEKINMLNDDDFKIATIRPPMVYGKGCKGNYSRLSKLAVKLPIFPKIKNERSMIYIDNLCEFIKLLINNESFGLFFPQNKEYVNTTEMVQMIASIHGKKQKITKLFNPIIKLLKIDLIKKIFGDLTYDKELSIYKDNYNIKDFKDSILETEGKY